MKNKEKIIIVIAVIMVIIIAVLGCYVYTNKKSLKTDQPIATEPAIKINNTLKTSVTVLPAPETNP